MIEVTIPLFQLQLQNRKIKYKSSNRSTLFQLQLENRKRIFARLGTDFVAGAALSQGQIQILWQAQHFRKSGHRFRGRHDTFARSSTVFRDRRYNSALPAAAPNSQELSTKVVFEVRFSSCSLKIATADFVAGAILSQGQYRCRGKRSIS